MTFRTMAEALAWPSSPVSVRPARRPPALSEPPPAGTRLRFHPRGAWGTLA